jgi:hypothetical protein
MRHRYRRQQLAGLEDGGFGSGQIAGAAFDGRGQQPAIARFGIERDGLGNIGTRAVEVAEFDRGAAVVDQQIGAFGAGVARCCQP